MDNSDKGKNTVKETAAVASAAPSVAISRLSRIPDWIRRVGAGILLDIRARAPFYKSDWTDAYNYRVVPATALIFFANVLPGIAFSLDLIETTQQYGVAEVLMSSFMAAFIFSVFGGQPLTIAGVTGPITVFNKTIYDILRRESNPPIYLHFIGWVYLWAAVFHWISALLNWCNFLKHVTLFSCDTFGFYVSWVYLQYGIQVLTRQLHSPSSTTQGALVSIILALLMLVTSTLFHILSTLPYCHRHVRRFLADYGMPISLIAASGMAYWGTFRLSSPETLPTGRAFTPAGDRQWLIRFWDMDSKWIGIALPFGFVLWILFFFDHNVSSLMAQDSSFPLRKPPAFHYDFFLLGVTTFIAGLLGLPAPNGLIPQAPIHTRSLVVMGYPSRSRDEEDRRDAGQTIDDDQHSLRDDQGPLSTVSITTKDREKDDTVIQSSSARKRTSVPASPPRPTSHPYPPISTPAHAEVPIAVVEQRVSNLAQGALSLVLLTGPFLHLLGLIPRGVLAGLFWYMGLDALHSNGITLKLLYLLRDHSLTPPSEPLHRVRKSMIMLFVAVQLVAFGATFGVTQTIAAIGFPVIIMLLIPLRSLVIPRMPFTSEELAILDGPAASPFTMESVGGVAV